VVDHRVLSIDGEPVADLILGLVVTLYSVRDELRILDGSTFPSFDAAAEAAQRLLPSLRAAA
jgi:hypothetical protein